MEDRSDMILNRTRSSIELAKFEKCYDMISNLKHQISFQNEENFVLDDALSQYRSQLNNLKSSIRTLEQQVENLEYENSDLLETIELHEQSKSIADTKIVHLEQDLEKFYSENRNLKEELSSVAESLLITQELNIEMKEEMEKLKSQISKLSSSRFHHVKAVKPVSDDKSLDEKLKSLKKIFEEKEQRSSLYSNERNSLSLLHATQESNPRIENLVSFAQNSASNEKIMKLESENRELHSKLSSYKQELQNIQEEMKSLSKSGNSRSYSMVQNTPEKELEFNSERKEKDEESSETKRVYKSAFKERKSPLSHPRTTTISYYKIEEKAEKQNYKSACKLPQLLGAKSPLRYSPHSTKSVKRILEDNRTENKFRKLENVHEAFKSKLEQYTRKGEFKLSRHSRF